MKTIYNIVKYNKEISFKNRYEIATGAAWEDINPQIEETFSSLEGAKKAFKNYKSSISNILGSSLKYYIFEEFRLEEVELDEELKPSSFETLDITEFDFQKYELLKELEEYELQISRGDFLDDDERQELSDKIEAIEKELA